MFSVPGGVRLVWAALPEASHLQTPSPRLWASDHCQGVLCAGRRCTLLVPIPDKCSSAPPPSPPPRAPAVSPLAPGCRRTWHGGAHLPVLLPLLLFCYYYFYLAPCIVENLHLWKRFIPPPTAPRANTTPCVITGTLKKQTTVHF